MAWYILTLVLGIILGFVVGKLRGKATDGELIIDTSNSERDIYRLELGNELENLSRKRTITLKIVHRIISREAR